MIQSEMISWSEIECPDQNDRGGIHSEMSFPGTVDNDHWIGYYLLLREEKDNG
jgi:hypothetical protein